MEALLRTFTGDTLRPPYHSGIVTLSFAHHLFEVGHLEAFEGRQTQSCAYSRT